MVCKKLGEEDIKAMFIQFGPIEECTVLRDDNGISRGITTTTPRPSRFIFANFRMCICYLQQPAGSHCGHQGDAPLAHHGGLQFATGGEVRRHAERQGAEESSADSIQSLEPCKCQLQLSQSRICPCWPRTESGLKQPYRRSAKLSDHCAFQRKILAGLLGSPLTVGSPQLAGQLPQLTNQLSQIGNYNLLALQQQLLLGQQQQQQLLGEHEAKFDSG